VILERVGGKEARALLEGLADPKYGPDLAGEAIASLERLKRKAAD
jgi:hypothetical protein